MKKVNEILLYYDNVSTSFHSGQNITSLLYGINNGSLKIPVIKAEAHFKLNSADCVDKAIEALNSIKVKMKLERR